MHHTITINSLQLLIYLVGLGVVSTAITYALCAYPLRRRMARLERQKGEYLNVAAGILEHHEEQYGEAAANRLIASLEGWVA